ncbi:MAG: thiol peroxidase [Brevinema sp.]
MLNLTFHGSPLTVEGDQLKVGNKAPDFTMVKTDLSPLKLSDIPGVKILVTAPSLDTGVCSVQTQKFNKAMDSLSGVTIVTLSLDLPFAQARWCGAEHVNKMIVASDYQTREFATKYALLIKELKLLARAAFVIDAQGTIRYFTYVPEIASELDYEAILSEAKKLI